MENKGIYRILNTINSKIYIGSASSKGGFKKRWNEHKSALNSNNHYNKHLQLAWIKYGGENFLFEVVEIINMVNEILSREQYYLDTLKPEYNICKIAGNTLGLKLSDEAKLKMSNNAKLRIGDKAPMYGKNHNLDTKLKISISKTGNCGGKNHPLYGKKHSEKTKLKQSLAKKGKTSPNKIEIIQFDLTDKPLKTWPSISEAAKAFKLNDCCNIVS